MTKFLIQIFLCIVATQAYAMEQDADHKRKLESENTEINKKSRLFNEEKTTQLLNLAPADTTIEQLKLLIDQGADVNFYPRYNGSFFIRAIEEHTIEIVRFLLTDGDAKIDDNVLHAVINRARSSKKSVANDSIVIAKLLIEYGATVKGSDIENALHAYTPTIPIRLQLLQLLMHHLKACEDFWRILLAMREPVDQKLFCTLCQDLLSKSHIDYDSLVFHFNKQLCDTRQEPLAPLLVKHLLDKQDWHQDTSLTVLMDHLNRLNLTSENHSDIQNMLNEYAKRKWGRFLLRFKLLCINRTEAIPQNIATLPKDIIMVIVGFLSYNLQHKV
jgi:hypothetical protein